MSPRTRTHGARRARPRRRPREVGALAARARRSRRCRGSLGPARAARCGRSGRDQQLLEFERPLSRSEAAAVARQAAGASRRRVGRAERARAAAAGAAQPTRCFAQQWWLQPVSGSNANAHRSAGCAAWPASRPPGCARTTAPAVVAVLDTGITRTPTWLGRVLPGYDFVSDRRSYANDGDGRDADPSDPGDWVSAADLRRPDCSPAACVENSSWHGTIIAGMVAANANNGVGGAGIHWGASSAAGARGRQVRRRRGRHRRRHALGGRPAGGRGAPLNPNPARIINISFGGSAACGAAYQSAMDELRAIGVVVVAAAGNEWSAPTRPASCSGVVGVAGLNRDGFKTNYSNFGASWRPAASPPSAATTTTAPGAAVLGRQRPGDADQRRLAPLPRRCGYARLYGTSFAAPQVAGTIALMLGLNPAAELRPDRARACA